MRPTDDPEMAALESFGTSMRRGRFMDALPEEEQRQITLVLTPGGGAEVLDDTGADPEGGDPMDAEEAMDGVPENKLRAPGNLLLTEQDRADKDAAADEYDLP